VENTVKNRITVEGRDGAFGAYIVRPTALPAPAVVVLHEVFGVNADRCVRPAEAVADRTQLSWRRRRPPTAPPVHPQ